MSLNAYLTVTGQKQGQIKGGVTQKGREGSVAVYAVDHEIISPRDASSGLPTGKRQHKPITITKELDKATPLLYKALVSNENLTEVVLKFFAANPNGIEVNSYIIKLTNASIASIHTDMENNKIDPGTKLPVLELVSFTYQKIEWTWVDGGITAGDNWQASA
ncbi:Hcp family type VI secretion system effector [Flavisolibacter ginsenosidimutans]|uniref:Hcp family type VI secretion system effector n=1 Tax=Flavisolibacter ginsenosidimutans TaxID=661481 RepID=A0A5B8UDF6_9BACT|nr:Hcp family type VI secretion system effector [Flavisolibacter ginsenosidimutans]QEC54707.1 Hcp family type VI secretion system effector [Flavisolibacter ginsenosidimutans]